jgi:hypothetical protein
MYTATHTCARGPTTPRQYQRNAQVRIVPSSAHTEAWLKQFPSQIYSLIFSISSIEYKPFSSAYSSSQIIQSQCFANSNAKSIAISLLASCLFPYTCTQVWGISPSFCSRTALDFANSGSDKFRRCTSRSPLLTLIQTTRFPFII